ncbi:PilN domain-containing protein [Candidatus Roizmanbacteria bacterium]|nr:PilN domain-containing protein [Candidatus Roizmanbacteria bacterium]
MKYTINLFPPKEQNVVDKVIYFSFHYLRYILVFTQLVVIGVFLYRFQVDQEIVDLKDILNQKQEIVEVSQPLIKQVEGVDLKIKQASTVLKRQTTFQAMTSYFLNRFPEKLTLTKLKIDDKNIMFEGKTTDADSVRVFYYRLLKEKQFDVIELESLNKVESGYVFNFVLKNFHIK